MASADCQRGTAPSSDLEGVMTRPTLTRMRRSTEARGEHRARWQRSVQRRGRGHKQRAREGQLMTIFDGVAAAGEDWLGRRTKRCEGSGESGTGSFKLAKIFFLREGSKNKVRL